jgi:hypothetical protein
MAGPERIEWRRSVPSAALTVLTWYTSLVGLAVGLVWILFGGEPRHLDSGATNPLAVLPGLALAVALVGLVPFVLPVLRRPTVAANHYALTVRAGPWRTLVLPWARLAAVTVHRTGGDSYLLVRLLPGMEHVGDRPGRADQGVLRSVRRLSRRGTAIDGYDLAVRMRDFVGTPQSLMSALAAFAPDHVVIDGDFADAA